ncbi:MAG: GAF domain-containing protein [Chloroflexota bacterium]
MAPPPAYLVRHTGPQQRPKRSLRHDRRLVADVARRLATSLDLSVILVEVMRLLHHRFGYGNTAVFLPDSGRRWLRLRAAYGDTVDPVAHAEYRQRADQGLIGEAFQTNRVVRVHDVSAHPRYIATLPEIRSELCVPLRTAGEVIGVLDVQLREAEGFQDDDETLLCEVADQLAPVLRNAALYEESQRRSAELRAMAEIAQAISSQLELSAVLDEIHQQVRRLMVVDASFVALEREVVRAAWPDADQLLAQTPASASPAGQPDTPPLPGLDHHDLVLARVYEGNERCTADEGRSLPVRRGGVAHTIARREPVLQLRTAEDVAVLEAGKSLEAPTSRFRIGSNRPSASLLFAPLIVGEEVLGALSVQSYHLDAYDDWHAHLLGTIANQAAVAVHNARLFTLAGEVRALRALNAMKDEFVATVSHELRTPLASIYGFAELLTRPHQKEGTGRLLPPVLRPDQQQRAISEIYAAADHMRRIIEDLLDISRLAQHALALHVQSVDAFGALADAQAMARGVLAQGQRIVLDVGGRPVASTLAEGGTGDHSPGGEAPAVLADPDRLRQVLLNLLSNASRYSQPGSTIRLGAAQDAPNAQGIHLWVADEGVGMTAEQCERAFDRFWRGPIQITGGRPGAGLGLAICRGLVEAMKGRIWAESPGPGHGSTFHVVLPAPPR